MKPIIRKTLALTFVTTLLMGVIFFIPYWSDVNQYDDTNYDPLAPGTEELSFTLNGYKVTLARTTKYNFNVVIIEKNQQPPVRVTSARCTIGHLNIDDVKGWNYLVPPGRNITGGTEPNLVISDWSGGANCCCTYRVYSLGKSCTLLGEIDTKNDETAHFEELTGDSIPEFVMRDSSFADLWGNLSESPAPVVVLRYTGQGYHPAPELMWRPELTQKEFAAIVTACRAELKSQNEDAPLSLRSVMIDQLYSGHRDLAIRLCNEVLVGWDKERKEKFMNLFAAQLEESSPYYRELPWHLPLSIWCRLRMKLRKLTEAADRFVQED